MKYFIFNLILFFFFFFLYIIYSANFSIGIDGGVYTFSPLIIFVLIYGNLKNDFSFFHILNIFNLSSLLFFFGTPLINIIVSQDLYNFESIVSKLFNKRDLDYCSIIVIISLLTINISCNLKIKVFNIVENNNFTFNDYIFNIGKWLMILSLPFILLLIFYQISYIYENGYLTIYTGGLSEINYPFPLLGYATYPFSYGFYLICSACPTNKVFNKYFFLLVIVALFESLKGGRFSLIGPVLFYFWYCSVNFGVRYNIKKLFLPLILLISLISFLTFNREKSESDVDLSRIAFSVISSQGRSTQLFSLYIENKTEVERYGKYMITSNLILPYLVLKYPSKIFQSQNVEAVLISNSFKEIITYVLNPDYYLNGGGMGGTYIVELYELGFIFCFVFSILFGIFLYNFSFLFNRFYLFRFLSLFLFLYVFIMPRAEALPNMLNLIKLVTFFSLVYIGFFLRYKSIFFKRKL